MAIHEDLQEAKAGSGTMISVSAAVRRLADQASVSAQDAAHWLALKGAHRQVPAYMVYPLGYDHEKLVLSTDERGVWHYQAVYDELLAIAYKDNLVVLMGSMSAWTKMPRARVAWVKAEIDAFIAENGGVPSQTGGAESPATADPRSRGGAGIMEMRKDKLEAAINQVVDDPMNIPVGVKVRLKKDLCMQDPGTFTASTFDKAWSDLSASGQIGIVGKETFRGDGGASE
ncbi:MAG TPA: hypothetical protein VIT62_09970 [Lysobacter sp.]